MDSSLVLVTGATGYVGGRLVGMLEEGKYRVRCMARHPEVLSGRVAASTEVVSGDLLEPDTLADALTGVTTAYYLVHSMGSSDSFESTDRKAATNFAAAAKKAGAKRIIYLGGLGNPDSELSPHLRSRHEVGEVLRASGIPVIEFRASIVIGAGSLSFEMIRSLVERLPLMITPKWVNVPAQPIYIDDVLAYLIAGLTVPIAEGRIFEIGGADQVSYAGIMMTYAEQRGIHMRVISVPVLTPYLSSLWLGLITPLYARIGRKLIESIIHSTVVRDNSALTTFPVRPRGVKEAICDAIEAEDRKLATTRWHDALSSSGAVKTWAGVRFGSRLVESRTVTVSASPESAFTAVHRIGGNTGWYAWNWLWKVRGALDLLVGGVGMRRGRPHRELRAGDALDFWRVESIGPRKLRLRAEMKLPGRAWLEFEVSGTDNRATIRQTAIFDPVGLAGRAYWYALFPVHKLVFAGMLEGIGREAVRLDSIK